MSTVLVLGSGGREHALAWKLSHSPQVKRLILVPGNDGVAGAERWVMPVSGEPALRAVVERARRERVELAVIGPDNALADGATDLFEAAGIRCFGPTRAAARLESSKGFAKDVMKAAGVPTAEYRLVKDQGEAKNFLRSAPWGEGRGWVVKADGLALGKGVRVCSTLEEACDAVDALLPLSGSLVIEEKLRGEEISWLAFCDGERCALLEPVRDHKRLMDGDRGPNTGGMGAYSPVPAIDPKLAEQVRERVFLPTLREMKKRGTPFKGVLYAGLMVDGGNFWVLEFNARFGDPETQVLMARMSGDLLSWCDAVARGSLRGLPEQVPFEKEVAVVVVGAAKGYPEQPEKGKRLSVSAISLKESDPHYFFAGVAEDQGSLVSSGGRVLGAMGKGKGLAQARAQAYERLGKARFEGMQFRSDIGAAAGSGGGTA